jgi:hypothetical protein
MGGFSIASVVLSYFLTAGGMLAGTLLMGKLHTSSEAVGLLCWALGSFIGGFFAARASRGSTIIEPAIGAILVVLTIIATAAGSDTGKLLWHMGGSSLGKPLAEVTAALVVGACAGAFVSEKMFGEATVSAAPWILYTALTSFGATFMVAVIVSILGAKGNATQDSLGKMFIIGAVIGALVAGIAVGASARLRVLGPAFVGGTLGTFGLFMLFVALFTAAVGEGANGETNKAIVGFAIISVGGGIVTLIGSAIGWSAIGKRNA